MRAPACPFAVAVLEAARNGQWSESLRSHVCECAQCAETARVAMWMGNVASHLGRDETAPDPTYIWLKAEIEKREQDAARMSLRELAAQTVLNLALTLAAAAALLSIWPQVSATATEARASVLTLLAQSSPADITVIGTIWLGLPLLIVATYLLVFRPSR